MTKTKTENAMIFVKTLECEEPATSFGDDMDVRVAGKTIQGQFPIDQGEFEHFDFYYPFSGSVTITFIEDGDADAAANINVTESSSNALIRTAFTIKKDGRYILHYRVLANDAGQKVVMRKNFRRWERILETIRNLPDFQDLTNRLDVVMSEFRDEILGQNEKQVIEPPPAS